MCWTYFLTHLLQTSQKAFNPHVDFQRHIDTLPQQHSHCSWTSLDIFWWKVLQFLASIMFSCVCSFWDFPPPAHLYSAAAGRVHAYRGHSHSIVQCVLWPGVPPQCTGLSSQSESVLGCHWPIRGQHWLHSVTTECTAPCWLGASVSRCMEWL